MYGMKGAKPIPEMIIPIQNKMKPSPNNINTKPRMGFTIRLTKESTNPTIRPR